MPSPLSSHTLRGGVAVVRGLLWFEFLHERTVIVNRLLSDAHFESPKNKAPPPNGEGADLKKTEGVRISTST